MHVNYRGLIFIKNWIKTTTNQTSGKTPPLKHIIQEYMKTKESHKKVFFITDKKYNIECKNIIHLLYFVLKLNP